MRYTFNRWDGYYLSDCDCELCVYYSRKHGCACDKCCCEDEKQEAIERGRIRRKNEGGR